MSSTRSSYSFDNLSFNSIYEWTLCKQPYLATHARAVCCVWVVCFVDVLDVHHVGLHRTHTSEGTNPKDPRGRLSYKHWVVLHRLFLSPNMYRRPCTHDMLWIKKHKIFHSLHESTITNCLKIDNILSQDGELPLRFFLLAQRTSSSTFFLPHLSQLSLTAHECFVHRIL